MDKGNSNPQKGGKDQTGFSGFRLGDAHGPKPAKTWKKGELEALKHSIAQYGLLKPFEVAEIHERLDFFYGRGRYLVIDGQRRYFAIRELLKLPTEDEERKLKNSLCTDSAHDQIANMESQARKQFDKLRMGNYVLVPCLVYPYTTLLQMVRHSIEDKRFSEQPSKEDYELADKMSAQNISDLYPDDLRDLWDISRQIAEERQSIEKTLTQIQKRLTGEQPDRDENA